MKLRYAVPALTFALALASQPVLAQGHRGGGSGGGHGGGGSRGGYGGGSHGGYSSGYRGGSHGGYGGSAVARQPSGGGMHYRSQPGYAPRGSVAQQRHPRAGTGSGYGYYPGHGYNHGGYGYNHGGYGYYRPYYGYGYGSYYPYYYPYYPYDSYWPGLSLSFGWGYGSSWPYYAGGYYGSPGYSVGVYGAAGGDDSGAAPPPARDADRSYEGPTGRVRLEVRPEDTSVYVDDQFRGTAREARIMNLPPGRHAIELVRPGFATERREVTVVNGESQDVLVELLRP
jgi:hypothetical protein